MNEQDPNGKSAKEPGSKLDAGKAPVMRGVLQYFPRAVKAVANLSLLGAQKYSWKGWETVPDGIDRYGDAAMRHAVDEELQGLYDLAWKEQGQEVLHATAVAWNALAKLELLIRKIEAKPKTEGTWLSEALKTTNQAQLNVILNKLGQFNTK